MDKLKEFWENTRERISNPLIFSFCISWLLINWRILISLLWYDPIQIKNSGATSIFDFIVSHCDKNAWWHALIFAVIYTFCMPPLRMGIRLFNVWIGKLGDNKSLKILKEGKIPIERYFSLRSEYLERTKLLEELITQEGKIQDQVTSKDAEIKGMTNDYLALQQQNLELDTFIRKSRDLSFLQGEWQLSYGNDLDNIERAEISNGQYHIMKPDGSRELKYLIEDYYYDERQKRMFFTKRKMTDEPGPTLSICQLTVKNVNLIEGRENLKLPVKYQRITSIGPIKVVEDEL